MCYHTQIMIFGEKVDFFLILGGWNSPQRLTTKKIEKCLYLCPNEFLSKNKGTFIRQTFHFLSESILAFFIFDQKRPKIAVLKFIFFIKKNLKT